MYEKDMGEAFGSVLLADQTIIHPVGLALLLLSGMLLFIVPRRFAVWPLLLIACFVSPAQRITVVTLDFNMLRIMVLFGACRILLRGGVSGFQWRPLDFVIISLALSTTIARTLLIGSGSAFVLELGQSFDTIGMYFLFRFLIRSWVDVKWLVRAFIFFSIPVAIFFIIENVTAHNLFSVFGGVLEKTAERYGRLRSQGAFAHPITAGVFWASTMPLVAAYWWPRPANIWPLISLLACVVIVYATASSTPVFAILTVILGGAMFAFRTHMKVIRWAALFAVVGLHIVMNAPVWHLISRVSAVDGSTGYFRYALTNAFINNFNEWWLMGAASTAHWFWGGQDLTNQYVAVGVRGGLISLVLFIIGIALAYRSVGCILQRVEHDRSLTIMSWGLGVALFVHTVSFLGVAYFGQIIMIWFMLLATITNMDIATEMEQSRRTIRAQPNQRKAFDDRIVNLRLR